MVMLALHAVDFARRLRELFERESSSTTRVYVVKNSYIYTCGEDVRALYLLASGRVKTVTYSHDGKKCLLAIHGPGDVFGELCLLPGRRTETATAMRDTVVDRISANRFLAALRDADLLRAFLRHLTVRADEQQKTITDLVMMDCEHRLAAVLLRLAWKLGRRERNGIRIDQRITQEELSEMVGTTRSRIGYFLKQFSEAGLVRRTEDCGLVVNERDLVEYLNSGS